MAVVASSATVVGDPSAPATDIGPLQKGEAVRAFYHSNDHPVGYRFVRLLDGPLESTKGDGGPAVVGLSTGWIPATVHEKWRSPADGDHEGRVLVKFHGRFMDAYKEEGEKPVDGIFWRVARSSICRMGVQQPQAELSLLVVRWWNYHDQASKRSPSHNVANEEMILNVLQGPFSPHSAFAAQARYEVHSAFVRNSSDLEPLGERLAASMRGRRRAALYFLWPTQRLAVERRLAGAVSDQALFGLMRRMEAAGVRSCWPHDSTLYRELSGKLWPPRVSGGADPRPDLKVPPTVLIDVERFERDSKAVAEDAILRLQALRVSSRNEPSPVGHYRGVVKLGFSWMGEDVRPFTGPVQLVKVLTQLLDGARTDAVCLVQERVENVTCELRFLCYRDMSAGPHAVQKELIRMRLHQPRHNDETFALTSHLTMNASEAASLAFKGSTVSLQTAEREAARLAERWLDWFRDEFNQTPSACRLDFLVSCNPGAHGAAPEVNVWTVELCECGGSLCRSSHHARTAACLNDCILGDGNGGSQALAGFPQALPPPRQEPAPAPFSAAKGSNVAPQKGRSGSSSVALTKQHQQRRRPLTEALAKLGFVGTNTSGRSVLSSLLVVIVLLWFRLRRRS
eukprot:TRINITY_DN3818_c1_g1_i1.p1 TRINITY_DN3818_c1_g1~~TRINITY_DN3818_c1_g1_i1.p1  ORF type:complete len:644 (-),score=75.36 TRINITY_DN3818_c1_g1_i1:85-1959(-)